MQKEYQFIECEGVTVAASLEARDQGEHPAYYPGNILFYIKQGQMHIRSDQKLFSFDTNNFFFVKKYTKGSYFKTWNEQEGFAQVYGFLLEDHLIRTALTDLGYAPLAVPKRQLSLNVLKLKENRILQGFFDSIIGYLEAAEGLDRQLISLKTKEALLGILKYHPEYASYFFQFSQPEVADLVEFMHHNYTYNIPLERLAQMSGRSLSKFNRDFRAAFQDTPHQWIVKKRLEAAKELLLNTDKKVSDIYLDLGFEDLGHFSRTFKKYFGKTPTALRKN